MRLRRRLLPLLVAAALAAGQVLAAAHDSEHALQAAGHGCAVCVYAHGTGAGALPSLPALVFAVPTERPEQRSAPASVTAARRHHPIRGPPSLPA